MQAGDLVKQPATTVSPNANILLVSKLMREDRTGAILVVEENQLVGIVTDRDVVTRLDVSDAHTLLHPVSQIMTRNPLTCPEDATVIQAAVIMADNQVRRLPVIDVSGKIIGLLTLDNIAEDYSENLAGETLGEIVEYRRKRPDPDSVGFKYET